MTISRPFSMDIARLYDIHLSLYKESVVFFEMDLEGLVRTEFCR